MEYAPINGGNPAMENVLRDMLSVADIDTVNHIMTTLSTGCPKKTLFCVQISKIMYWVTMTSF